MLEVSLAVKALLGIRDRVLSQAGARTSPGGPPASADVPADALGIARAVRLALESILSADPPPAAADGGASGGAGWSDHPPPPPQGDAHPPVPGPDFPGSGAGLPDGFTPPDRPGISEAPSAFPDPPVKIISWTERGPVPVAAGGEGDYGDPEDLPDDAEGYYGGEGDYPDYDEFSEDGGAEHPDPDPESAV